MMSHLDSEQRVLICGKLDELIEGIDHILLYLDSSPISDVEECPQKREQLALYEDIRKDVNEAKERFEIASEMFAKESPKGDNKKYTPRQKDGQLKSYRLSTADS